MKTALHGDRVAIVPFAQPIRRSGRGDTERPEAEIVEILQRAITTVVGELSSSRNFWFVAPDDSRIRRDIYVPSDEARKIGPKKKVVVRLLPWEDEHLNPEGEIIEVLGTAGDARVEVLSVARSFGLPMEFPPEVEREAAALNAKPDEKEVSSRLDLRKHLCITIDPEDAKDFDDAVSFETLDSGLVRLGVHIADVSHYVREGSALDGEAIQRGTSVYLVNDAAGKTLERSLQSPAERRPPDIQYYHGSGRTGEYQAV
jgi:ribonuclease R